MAEFCAGFREGDTIDMFIPVVTRRLREKDSVAYSENLPGINRQKLHRRLWAGLKREAAKYQETSSLRRAFLREKGVKVRGEREGKRGRAMAPLACQGFQPSLSDNDLSAGFWR